MQPGETWESEPTKRRIDSLIKVSGLHDALIKVKARYATKDEILLFHTESYHDRVVEMSKQSKGGDGGRLF